jgi:hypothetical protein
MRRLFVLWLLAAAVLGAQTPPDAPTHFIGSPCAAGANAAASLLIPYFEVDSQDEAGMDTLVGIVNIDDDPIVAHVTVWNVDAWAVFTFNIVLSGYDVCTFSMRQLLVYGNFPNNGCATDASRFTTRYIDCNGDGQYFDDAWTVNDGLISLAGSAWDVACYADAGAATTADWQCKLSIGSYDGWNANFVGYLTIDASIACTGGRADYDFWPWFAVNYLDTNADGLGDHGALENGNILMGDIFYIDQTAGELDGIPAVHLEALGEANVLPGHTWGFQPEDMERWGVNTFWYKYEHHAGLPPNDLREALPVRWAFRFSNPDLQHPDLETWVDIWRSGSVQFEHHWVAGGPCAWGSPAGAVYTMLYNPFTSELGMPLPWYIPRDDEGNETISSGPPPPWPAWMAYLASQRLKVDVENEWGLGAWDGWIDIKFDVEQDYMKPGYGSTFDQSWVTLRYKALGKYTVSATATVTMGGCALKVDDATGQLHPAPTQ